jgi:tetratricopeptide (TPR) repeat protein
MKRKAIVGAALVVVVIIFLIFRSGKPPLENASGRRGGERSESLLDGDPIKGSGRAVDARINELKDGKIQPIIGSFENFLLAAGHSPEAWIVAYLGTNSQPAILEELKKFPDNPNACYILSLGVATPFESLSWAQKLASLQPNNGYAKLVLANALAKQGRYEEAAELKKSAFTAADFHGYGEGPAKCLAKYQDSLGETEKLSLVVSSLDSKFYLESQLIALWKSPNMLQDPRERLENFQRALERINTGSGFSQFSTEEEKSYSSRVAEIRLMASTFRNSKDPELKAELKPILDSWIDPPDPRMNSIWDQMEPAEVSMRLQKLLDPLANP